MNHQHYEYLDILFEQLSTSGVVVKLNDTLLVAGKDYTVSYINNKKVGTATVIVNGIVQYTGSCLLYTSRCV